jgi:hypothetical protein
MSESSKNQGGRPPALEPTDEVLKVVFGLGKIQATLRECAAVLGVGEATFLRFQERHPIVKDHLERGQHEGLASLRRAQFKKAIEGQNPAMLIWLGKQYLAQKEQINTTSSVVVTDESKTLRYDMTDEQLLAIAGALDDAQGSGDGNAEASAGQNVTRRLQ